MSKLDKKNNLAPGQNGLRKILFDFFSVEKYERGEDIVLILNPDLKTCNEMGIFDDGLLLAIADEVSSICGPILLNKHKNNFAYSLNLKKNKLR